jgi:UDP-N-acetyl-2-amino-2-deoxyglucuronate dehydrogenase
MKKFVIIGAGYIFERHLKAIQQCGGKLICILDPNDSVGLVDSYFPKAEYFNEFERFDRYCTKRGDIDYTVVCSPNYLHSSHIMFGLRIGSDVICEKPLVLRERNLDELLKIEEQTGQRVWNILQLRLSDVYQRIISHLNELDDGHLFDISLDYFAPRGVWYDYSWKMSEERSGGLICNIGIHLLDLLCEFFGNWDMVSSYDVSKNRRNVFFSVEFVHATVYVELSIDKPEKREITIDGISFDLTPNMKNLHTKSYEQILAGKGFGIEETRQSISLCDELRNTAIERGFK